MPGVRLSAALGACALLASGPPPASAELSLAFLRAMTPHSPAARAEAGPKPQLKPLPKKKLKPGSVPDSAGSRPSIDAVADSNRTPSNAKQPSPPRSPPRSPEDRSSPRVDPLADGIDLRLRTHQASLEDRLRALDDRIARDQRPEPRPSLLDPSSPSHGRRLDTCPQTCFSATCDAWADYCTCVEMESQYGCDCA